VLRETSGSLWCQWKGQAYYYDLVTDTRIAPKANWSYLNPAPGFEPIAGAGLDLGTVGFHSLDDPVELGHHLGDVGGRFSG
jgi:Domain of unknown function (DUF427)